MPQPDPIFLRLMQHQEYPRARMVALAANDYFYNRICAAIKPVKNF